MKKRILVLHRYPPRQVVGTNASFMEFLRELIRNDYEVYYLTYKEEEKYPKEMEGLEYIRLPFTFDRSDHSDKVRKTYLWIVLAPFYVRSLQKKYNFNLVYCDDSVPYYGFIAKMISPRSKVVIRLGDLQTGYSLADTYPMLFKIALKIEVIMWKKLDGVVAISEPFKKYIIEQGVDKKKITYVQESINLKNTDFSDIAVPRTKKIMFHGSLLKCKGLETLFDAFKIFKKKHKDVGLIIAGGGGEEEAIKSYAKKIKLRNVTFTGWYNHEKLAKLMREVQVSVVMRSSNMANNFVVTTCLLENWAYKKPTLVPKLAAFEKVIEDKKNAVYYEPDDAKDLAEKMDYLYENTDIYEKLVKGGLKTANNVFNHHKIAKNMVRVLKSYL